MIINVLCATKLVERSSAMAHVSRITTKTVFRYICFDVKRSPGSVRSLYPCFAVQLCSFDYSCTALLTVTDFDTTFCCGHVLLCLRHGNGTDCGCCDPWSNTRATTGLHHRRQRVTRFHVLSDTKAMLSPQPSTAANLPDNT